MGFYLVDFIYGLEHAGRLESVRGQIEQVEEAGLGEGLPGADALLVGRHEIIRDGTLLENVAGHPFECHATEW